MPTLYHQIYGFSMFNTLTKALHEIVSIIQIISSFLYSLEIPSYIPLFSQCDLFVAELCTGDFFAAALFTEWFLCS